jgi:hypothetical protein
MLKSESNTIIFTIEKLLKTYNTITLFFFQVLFIFFIDLRKHFPS